MPLEAKRSSLSARMCSMTISKKAVEVKPGALLRDYFPEQFKICNMLLAWLLSNGTPCFFSNGFLCVCLLFSSQQNFHAHLSCSLCFLPSQRNRITELISLNLPLRSHIREIFTSLLNASQLLVCAHTCPSCGLASEVLPCEEWSILLCTSVGGFLHAVSIGDDSYYYRNS